MRETERGEETVKTRRMEKKGSKGKKGERKGKKEQRKGNKMGGKKVNMKEGREEMA